MPQLKKVENAGKSSRILSAGTHGSKMNGKGNIPVIEQGEELSFYQSYRNEPVPPDPNIISAVKHTPAVRPTSKHNIPKGIEPGMPVMPEMHGEKQNYSAEVSRLDNSIPCYYHLFGPAEVRDRKEPKVVVVANVTQNGNHSGVSVPEESYSVCSDSDSDRRNQVRDEISKLNLTGSESLGQSSLGRIRSLDRAPEQERLEKNEIGKDAKMDRHGPKVFLFSDPRPLLQDVKFVNVSGPDDFMIVNVNLEKLDQLESLQREMFACFTSLEGSKSLTEDSSKSFLKRGYYGLLIPEQETCIRVQLLCPGEKSEDVYVFCLDYGLEKKALRKFIVPLKPEWKDLEQLSCHAQIEGDYDQEEAKIFPSKYQDKTVCIELKGMFPKIKSVAGKPVRVKCCRVEIFNEQAAFDFV